MSPDQGKSDPFNLSEIKSLEFYRKIKGNEINKNKHNLIASFLQMRGEQIQHQLLATFKIVNILLQK